MRFTLKFFCSLLAVLLVTACAEVLVKEVDYASMREMPEEARPRALKFSGIEILLPPGTEIGLEGGLGRFCSWPRYPVERGIIKKSIDRKFIKQSFHDAMEANGYDVVDSIDIAFRAEDELQRAEYFVRAKIKDIDLDTCRRGLNSIIPLGDPGVKGKFYMAVDWSIYDALRRKVVYKLRTEGYTKRTIPNVEGMSVLFHDAFEMATHNLAADTDFYALIVEGKAPPGHWRKGGAFAPTLKDEPRKFNPREHVNITQAPLSRQPVPKHIDEIRQANVLIQKSGHGSGFFITPQGHILTNQHVVGDATRMRIVTRGKRRKLIAEVLRVDRVRDVALLKLEEEPKHFEITPLPIRTEKLTVSEDVYALGNPILYGSLQDTVTKGIVSAHRLYRDEGIRLPFIQADVDIHGGNSGGALLDEYGNIVGLSVSGISFQESKLSSGLNFFIPINEALKALDITLEGAAASDYPLSLDEEEEDDPEEDVEKPILPEE